MEGYPTNYYVAESRPATRRESLPLHIAGRIPFVHSKKVVSLFLKDWRRRIYRRKRYRELFLASDLLFK